jgi:hypothetical protein
MTAALSIPSSDELQLVAEALAVVASEADAVEMALASHDDLNDDELGRVLLFARELRFGAETVQSTAASLDHSATQIALEAPSRSAMPSRVELADWLLKKSATIRGRS